MGADEIRQFIRRYPWGARALDLVGGLPAVLSVIAGLSVVTAIFTFFGQHPYLALPAGAFFAYYAIAAWLKAKEWWEKDSLDHKIVYEAAPCRSSQNPDGTFDVVPAFLLKNHAAFDIMIKFDSESFRIKDKGGADSALAPAMVIQANSSLGYCGGTISGVTAGYADRIKIEFCARYGKTPRRLNKRWFVRAENHLPANLSNIPHSNPLEWTMLRNDVETVLE